MIFNGFQESFEGVNAPLKAEKKAAANRHQLPHRRPSFLSAAPVSYGDKRAQPKRVPRLDKKNPPEDNGGITAQNCSSLSLSTLKRLTVYRCESTFDLVRALLNMPAVRDYELP